MRLDKYLSSQKVGSRSQCKTILRAGAVTVNGQVVKDPGQHVEPLHDLVCVHGSPLRYVSNRYYMLHKPNGCVSATRDERYPTVLDHISGDRSGLFPVGRLDLDTEGLLLITDDGALAHELLSPKKHIPKTYYARVDGLVTDEDVRRFSVGLDIGEKRPALPAELKIIAAGEESEVNVTIYEGKFHQVKRMFAVIGKPVLYLCRIAMGSLTLDPGLAPGECRSLTEVELLELRNIHEIY